MKTLKEFTQWLEEETATHSDFSIEELKRIGKGASVNQETQVAIYRYLKSTLGQSNWSGSFRYAWILDEQRILKLIKGVDRISQNQQELKNSTCLGSHFSVQVLDYHPQFYWLIEERVNQLSEQEFVEEFSKQTGIKLEERTEFDDGLSLTTSIVLTDIVEHFVTGKKRDRYKTIYSKFSKSKWFMSLINKLKGCKVSSEDFHFENWGIRPSTGELVLLDLGF
jgi:hypothetical protein